MSFKKADISRIARVLVQGRWAMLAVCLMTLIVEMYAFHLQIFDDRPSVVSQSVKLLSDALLMVVLFWFVPPRFKAAALLVPVWLTSFFLLANLLYFRFYNTLIPISSFFFFANFDGLVFNSVLALWRNADLLFVVAPVLTTLIVVMLARAARRGEERRVKKRWPLLLTACLYLLCQGYYCMLIKRGWDESGIPRNWSVVLRNKYVEPAGTYFDYGLNGLPAYVFKGIVDQMIYSRKVIDLDREQLAFIADYMASRPHDAAPIDSAFASNRAKNLIFIIVESLNAEVIGAEVNALEITPGLNRLMREPGCISALNVITQISDGGSSDGQLLYNAGLLPLKKGATMMLYEDNVYPGLPKAMPDRYAMEITCDKPRSWNHDKSTRLYGYQRMDAIEELRSAGLDVDAIGRDKALFEYTKSVIPTLKQPFLLTLTTLSMHIPFIEPAASTPAEIAAAEIPEIEKKYYTVTRYTDACIADFISWLKQEGIYDNSVVVIASDHNCVFSEDKYIDAYNFEAGRVVFMALNAGRTMQIDRFVGQIDVYPTLLEIMGLSGSVDVWQGLGTSMLTPLCDSAVDKFGNLYGTDHPERTRRLADAWQVSDLLIRSNYFATSK